MKTALELNGIDTYYGKAQVLFDVSLNMEEGETVALLGRNGAGKTTILRSIIGINPPKSGSIKFFGEEIAGLDPTKISRMGMGYVPEDRQIYSDLTVGENLAVGRKRKTGGKWTDDSIYELFPSLEQLRNSRGENLSGGEQQMLTIARTLIGNPKVLLLDEPSEGLAPLLVEKLRDRLSEIEAETTILIAEQNAKFCLFLANRAYAVEKGKIIFEGTADEIQQREKLQRRLAI